MAKKLKRKQQIMKKELMNILACPICKFDIVLNIEKENNDEIIEGTLYCKKCDKYYPIENGIPNMIPG